MTHSKSDEVLNALNYYNKNSKLYFDRTIKIDMSPAREKFLHHLFYGTKILDARCGVGRDTKAFLEAGYDVIAIDASEEMVKTSTEYTGQKTLHLYFEDMAFESEFDGIWCSASLLHVPSHQLLEIMRKFEHALKPGGVWFFSFMHGEFEGFKNERFYHHLNKDKLRELLKHAGHFK